MACPPFGRKLSVMFRFLRIACALAAVVSVVLAAVPSDLRADQTDPALTPLFDHLKTAANEEEAQVITEQIWHIWLNSGQELVDSAMGRGIVAMHNGAYDTALKDFEDVTSLAPDMAEGWNKKATVLYLMGRFPESVVAIERTLKLEPRHFGALSGLGMIYLETGQKKAAIAVLEKALAINPFMVSVKAHLRALKQEVDGRGI